MPRIQPEEVERLEKQLEHSPSEIHERREESTKQQSIDIARSVANRTRRMMVNLQRAVYQWFTPRGYLLSRGLTASDIEELTMLCAFDFPELGVLLDLFSDFIEHANPHLSEESSRPSTLTLDQVFDATPFLKHCPFRERMYELFAREVRDSQSVSFVEYCSLLSVLSKGSTQTQKIKFAFDIYDRDLDGEISKEDLRMTLHNALGGEDCPSSLGVIESPSSKQETAKEVDLEQPESEEEEAEESATLANYKKTHLSDQEIDEIVEKTFAECTLTQRKGIDFVEFNSIVSLAGIVAKFNLNL